MALGYPDSATGAGPTASIARLVKSQPIHSSVHPPASHLPPIHQPFHTHIYTSVYAYISPSNPTAGHPPTDPSISTSIQHPPLIYSSTHLSIIHSSTHHSIHHLSSHSSTHHPYTCQSIHCLSTHLLFIYPSTLPAHLPSAVLL